MAETVEATWTVELNAECPKCDEFVNLLDYPDFWAWRRLDIGEHMTKRSGDQQVNCPKCSHEFTVECVY